MPNIVVGWLLFSAALFLSTPASLATAIRCTFEGGGIGCSKADLVTFSALARPFDTKALAQATLCKGITESRVFPSGVGTMGRWQGGDFHGLWDASVSEEVCRKAASDPGNNPTAVNIVNQMLPVLNSPRCANCHGGIDVFAKNTTHLGGVMKFNEDDPPLSFQQCQACHDQAQGQWKVSLNKSVLWAGSTPANMCRAMKGSRSDGQAFLDHLKTDILVRLGFEGKRGQDLPAQPPPMTQAQFIALAEGWVNAMEAKNKWPSDPAAGCPT